jgi:predicted esterase
MKLKLLYSVIFLYFLIFIVSCSNDNNVSPTSVEQAGNIISCDKIEEINQSQITLISLFSGIDIVPVFEVEVYNIKYYSIGRDNKIIQCSGIICVPKTPIRMRGIVSYQHPSILSNKDIPSDRTSIEHYVPLFTATNGYIATSNDYIGYGSSIDEIHPYHIYSYNSDDWYYFIKASQDMISNRNYNIENDLWIVGYSQGGYNAVAAMKKMESSINNTLNLKAVFDGDGALELSTLMHDIYVADNDNYVAIDYGFMFIQAYNEYYNMKLNYSDIFTEKYKNIIEALFYEAKHSNKNISNDMPKTMRELYTENFINSMKDGSHPIYNKLLSNNLTNDFTPSHKLYMYHSKNDDAIPYSSAYSVYNKFKAVSGNVEFVDSEAGLNHTNTFLEFHKFVLKKIILGK